MLNLLYSQIVNLIYSNKKFFIIHINRYVRNKTLNSNVTVVINRDEESPLL